MNQNTSLAYRIPNCTQDSWTLDRTRHGLRALPLPVRRITSPTHSNSLGGNRRSMIHQTIQMDGIHTPSPPSHDTTLGPCTTSPSCTRALRQDSRCFRAHHSRKRVQQIPSFKCTYLRLPKHQPGNAANPVRGVATTCSAYIEHTSVIHRINFGAYL